MVEEKAKKSDRPFLMAVLAILFCLSAVRYYPGDAAATAVATAEHLLSTVPLVLGFTLLLLSVLRRLAGVVFNFGNGIKFFLLVGLLVEFVYAIHHYLSVAQGLPPA